MTGLLSDYTIQHEVEEMGTDLPEYLKSAVWYDYNEYIWRFGIKRYRRKGQALKAAYSWWLENTK